MNGIWEGTRSLPFVLAASLAAVEVPGYITWLLPLLIIGVIVQFFWASFISFVIYRMSKIDRTSEAAEARLHETTKQLVDERFRAMTHEVNGHVQSLVTTLDFVTERLKTGDSEMRELVNGDHSLELKLAQRVEQIKDYIRDHAASKTDLQNHQDAVATKFDRMSERMGEMGRELAVLSEKVKN